MVGWPVSRLYVLKMLAAVCLHSSKYSCFVRIAIRNRIRGRSIVVIRFSSVAENQSISALQPARRFGGRLTLIGVGAASEKDSRPVDTRVQISEEQLLSRLRIFEHDGAISSPSYQFNRDILF